MVLAKLGVVVGMMALWVLDENLDTVEVITQFESLVWTKRWLGVGEFHLVVSEIYTEITASKDDPSKIRYVYRADSDYIGRVDNIIYEDGKIQINGSFLEGLFSFRYNTVRNVFSGNIETVIHNVVNQNCIINKPIPHLTLGVNNNLGERIDADIFGKQIANYLYELSTVHGCSYNVKFDRSEKAFIFSVLWGLDRTQEQTVNDWCLFGRQWGNIYSERYDTNTNYSNYAVVYGEGEGADRLSEIVDIRRPNEEMRELFVDARDLQQGDLSLAEYRKTLRDRGLKRLAEQGKFDNIFADVRVASNMPYSLGDVVSVKHESTGLVFYMPITEEREIFEAGKIEKKISFGERQGGIMASIKNKE